jgi:hypothetical protein
VRIHTYFKLASGESNQRAGAQGILTIMRNDIGRYLTKSLASTEEVPEGNHH